MKTPTDDDAETPNLKDPDRRGFIASATTLVAGAAATILSSPAQAQGVGSARGNGNGPYPTQGMAAYGPTGPLKPMDFQRRALGPKDVAIKIHYCGVCHSDIHTIRGDWGKIQYPQIVGHEVSGKVVAVGSSVGRFKPGARVGVGTMVNSCRRCSECASGFENYCLNGNTQIYGSKDKDGTITQGGYSTFIVVDEDFVLDIPDPIDLADAGPLLCAGITVYHPLRRWGVSPGKRVAIVGMGGLGHLAVKFAKAMGAEVTVFTTTPSKSDDAKRFGAKNVVVNKDGADFSAFKHAFDFALDTIPYKHDLNRFIPLLQPGATYCRVGVGKVVDSNEIGQMNLVLYRNALAGANTGRIRETQDMLTFCALNKIRPQIQKISMTGIDGAWTSVFDKKARYRHVIDMKAS
jgi:alcohol dehydrogenase (NADP+)